MKWSLKERQRERKGIYGMESDEAKLASYSFIIFLIAVMITPVWIGKICLLMVMSIHHFIMLKKVEIINE